MYIYYISHWAVCQLMGVWGRLAGHHADNNVSTGKQGPRGHYRWHIDVASRALLDPFLLFVGFCRKGV
jgi:hypothetical protein